jgi:hypothetical protein
LAVLVPMAARRRQPMSRPSDAALSCRVLERPRRRDPEVTAMDAASNSAVPNNVTSNTSPPNGAGAGEVAAPAGAWSESSGYAGDGAYPDQHHADYGADAADYDRDAVGADYDYSDHDHGDHGDHGDRDHGYSDDGYGDRGYATGPARRYRPGRGGYDAEAAAAAARARYVVRQRLVLGLVLLAVATGLLAGGLHLVGGWYLHAAVDLCLVGYLVYLRRQVRVEQAIRARRAARMAGGRYRADAGSPLLDDPLGDAPEYVSEYAEQDAYGPGVRHAAGPMVRRGRRSRVRRRPTVAEAVAAREAARRRAQADAQRDADAEQGDAYEDDYDEYGYDADGDDADGGDGGYDEADDGTAEQGGGEPDQKSALPRLRPSAPPERPRGTVVLELDDEDPELHDLDSRPERGYRRAAGQ